MPASNITVVAQWTKGIASEYVEIVFERKDITKKEVDDFIKKQTEAEYIITAFEKNTDGDIKAIVKFTDKEDAREFARAINERPERTVIKRVAFVDDPAKSISTRMILTSIIYFIIN